MTLVAVPPQVLQRGNGEPAGQNQDAGEQAHRVLEDQELARLLAAPRDPREVARSRQVFVNRNLRLANVELIGFDMDYTLAIYHMRRLEQLSFDLTLAKLIA